MAPLHFVFPGDPATCTGGFHYDRRMVEGLRAAGHDIALHALPDGFPETTPAHLAAADKLLGELPDDAVAVVDGLAFGVLAEVARAHAARLRLVALVHHPLAAETGLSDARRAALFGQERDALALARRVITTSAHTARSLAAYGIAQSEITVVTPGVDSAPLARGSNGAGFTLLCVATLIPRKGHALLLDALGCLDQRAWRLLCAGSDARDPSTAEALRARCTDLGLMDRVAFLGEVPAEDLNALYNGADLFVLASHHEGYGMVLSEALARGLPVVATSGGAISETVPPDAGLLVPPGDGDALTDALARAIGDDATRARLAAGARAARGTLADWNTAAQRFARALDGLAL